ncbi:hypothetical protein D9M72_266540 [compost metagenome]
MSLMSLGRTKVLTIQRISHGSSSGMTSNSRAIQKRSPAVNRSSTGCEWPRKLRAAAISARYSATLKLPRGWLRTLTFGNTGASRNAPTCTPCMTTLRSNTRYCAIVVLVKPCSPR